MRNRRISSTSRKARSCDEARGRAFGFQDSVGGYRCGVNDFTNILTCSIRIADEGIEPLHYSLREVIRGGRDLRPRSQPLGIHEDKVGEGTTNIHTDTQ